MTGQTVIEVRNLVKQYPNKAALTGISFDVHAGEIIGLLGPNGAGKSTAMKILTTYLSATSGQARIDGLDLQRDAVKIRAILGYLPESTPLYNDMVAYEYLMYVGEMRGFSRKNLVKRIADVARTVGLQDVIGMTIGTLSKGYKQRVGLAQALLHNPKILILDEPTSGLDPNQIIEIRNLIRDLGKNHTVILSSHNLTEVRQICDRIVIIHKGAVVADGTVQELEGQMETTQHIVVGVAPKTDTKTDEIQELLSQQPQVTAVVLSHEVAVPVETLVFEVQASADVRPQIATALQKAGHTLVELRRKAMDLEGIFQQLTMNS